MNFKKQLFGFMDMLRFKKLVPNRRAALANGPDTPLPEDYRVNQLPGGCTRQMRVELTDVSPSPRGCAGLPPAAGRGRVSLLPGGAVRIPADRHRRAAW